MNVHSGSTIALLLGLVLAFGGSSEGKASPKALQELCEQANPSEAKALVHYENGVLRLIAEGEVITLDLRAGRLLQASSSSGGKSVELASFEPKPSKVAFDTPWWAFGDVVKVGGEVLFGACEAELELMISAAQTAVRACRIDPLSPDCSSAIQALQHAYNRFLDCLYRMER